MAFIVNKKSTLWGKTRNLYYLVKNYRDGEKIKRERLLKMGENKNLTEFLESTEREEEELLIILEKKEKIFDDFTKYGIAPKLMSASPSRVYKNLTWFIQKAKDELEECRSRKKAIKSFM